MGIYDEIARGFANLPPCDVQALPALALAYVGDTVYDLFVRTLLARRGPAGAHALHMAATTLVCAAGQAAAFRRVEPLLTEPYPNTRPWRITASPPGLKRWSAICTSPARTSGSAR